VSTPKIALVTGASRGLGRSMAHHLAAAGVGVIGTYLTHPAEADPPRSRAHFHRGSRRGAAPERRGQRRLRPVRRRRATLDQFGVGRIDYLIHNAGSGVYAPFAETTQAQFDDMIAIHLKAPFFLTQTLLPLIADGGAVLNVSSGLARFTGPGYAAYAAAKGAVEVITRYQAQELGARRIRVNALVPGAIATDFGGGLVRDNTYVNAAIAQAIALGRVGEPDDIGAAVPAILSDALHWATGTRIELSGGQSL